LPVFRKGGQMELLPPGYDPPTHTWTECEVEYATDMTLEQATEALVDLFGEFHFTDDDGRSQAVAISALLGQYCAQLLPRETLRPVFIFDKNAEGAGASTLVLCVVIPVQGMCPFTALPKEDGEMSKLLSAVVRNARQVLVFDNVRGFLDSPPLEFFVSSSDYMGRKLGHNEELVGTNISTVFITSNGLTYTSDMRRRRLIAELHLSVERAEDQVFDRRLNKLTLLVMRPRILAACWALLRNWFTLGQPPPSRSHSAFPEWADLVAGVVESAGFTCPLNTPKTAAALDENLTGMRQMTQAMILEQRYTFAQLADLCREQEVFLGLAGEKEMAPGAHRAFGHLLAHYQKRKVVDRYFVIDGEYRGKRYWVTNSNPLHSNDDD
jgi:putative DNA primase/helicase